MTGQARQGRRQVGRTARDGRNRGPEPRGPGSGVGAVVVATHDVHLGPRGEREPAEVLRPVAAHQDRARGPPRPPELVVVGPGALTPERTTSTTPGAVTTVPTGAGAVTALVPDRTLSALLTDPRELQPGAAATISGNVTALRRR